MQARHALASRCPWRPATPVPVTPFTIVVVAPARHPFSIVDLSRSCHVVLHQHRSLPPCKKHRPITCVAQRVVETVISSRRVSTRACPTPVPIRVEASPDPAPSLLAHQIHPGKGQGKGLAPPNEELTSHSLVGKFSKIRKRRHTLTTATPAFSTAGAFGLGRWPSAFPLLGPDRAGPVQ